MKVLIAEDDRALVLTLVKGLVEKGFSTQTACDGEEALSLIRSHQFDVLIVDRMMPKLDGLSLIKTIRAENIKTPALLLTALTEIDDKVEGLMSGADDYMGKPFSLAELVARLHVLSKRGQAVPKEKTTFLEVGDVQLDRVSRNVIREGQPISLQPREFDLLYYFMSHADQVVTRKMLLENVWNYSFDPQTNIVDVHVSRLRNKIDKNFDTKVLSTIRGVGYIFQSKEN